MHGELNTFLRVKVRLRRDAIILWQSSACLYRVRLLTLVPKLREFMYCTLTENETRSVLITGGESHQTECTDFDLVFEITDLVPSSVRLSHYGFPCLR